MRDISWRADHNATLMYVEALDEGDPDIEVHYRDAVYVLDAPFTGKGDLILKTINRFQLYKLGRPIMWP